jgi:integrase
MYPPFVSEVLRGHRARQAEERLAAGPAWHEADLLFSTAEGNPLDGLNRTHRFQRLLEWAGVPRRKFHDLRHSCATVLLAQGVPVRLAMEMPGHSQISLKMNTYTHVLRTMQRDAADLMGKVLGTALMVRRMGPANDGWRQDWRHQL